jgi:hypothetical protein
MAGNVAAFSNFNFLQECMCSEHAGQMLSSPPSLPRLPHIPLQLTAPPTPTHPESTEQNAALKAARGSGCRTCMMLSKVTRKALPDQGAPPLEGSAKLKW